MSTDRKFSAVVLLFILCLCLLVLCYVDFFSHLFRIWVHDADYSFGILIPLLVAYLMWSRRKEISASQTGSWRTAVILVVVGCALQILATRSGSMLASGIALVLTLLGLVGYLWGKQLLARVAGPLGILVLMVPLPSYAVGEISWYLQSAASTASGAILGLMGVPVYQDGNLLKLPNYVLEVKQACSGSHSIFALLALSCALALSMSPKSWLRVFVIIAAPILAFSANVIRIVGTGLIAREWGNLAANESLHEVWGIAVFLIAVLGLLGLRNLLRLFLCKLE